MTTLERISQAAYNAAMFGIIAVMASPGLYIAFKFITR